MPEKQKSSKKSRAHKESQGKHGAGGKVRLSELEKVLLVKGGMGHHLRKGVARRSAEDTKAGRRRIAEAKAATEAAKAEERRKKLSAKAAREMHASS